MPISVLIAADVDQSLLQRLRADQRFAVDLSPVRTAEELGGKIGNAEVLVSRHHNRITAGVLDQASHLKLIVQGTSGLDNIDPSTSSRGIVVVGTPGANANAVAELAIAQMIHLTRTVPGYNQMIRSGNWNRDDCATRRELRGYRLGIAGLGRVGGRVAAMARWFGMTPSAYDPYLGTEEMSRRGAEKVESLDELLHSSDIFTLHVPLTEETRGMIGAREIGLLPPGAIVINMSRGAVLDLRALLEALEANRIGGAALDVFPEEPPADVRWPDDPRLVLTPHIAGCSREAKASIGEAVYLEICRFYGFEPVRRGA